MSVKITIISAKFMYLEPELKGGANFAIGRVLITTLLPPEESNSIGFYNEFANEIRLKGYHCTLIQNQAVKIDGSTMPAGDLEANFDKIAELLDQKEPLLWLLTVT